MTIASVLNDASQSIVQKLAVPNRDARVEARILMQWVLGVSHAWLLAHAEQSLETEDHDRLQVLLNRRLQGEPMAYVLGQREFFGLTLKVTPDTLIPRPDTETLVEAALQYIPQVAQGYQALDMGTGTGAIALAIAKNRPEVEVTAVDVSPQALHVAQTNAQQLGLLNVVFQLSDWFSALKGQTFDMVVSNPPYIAVGDMHLQQGDLRFEPIHALSSGLDGLNDIRHIVANSPLHIKKDGWLLLEHGFDQADAVAALLKARGFQNISHAKDIAEIRRVTLGQWQHP